MKKTLPWLACLVLLCAAFGANQIKWQWQGHSILPITEGSSRLEFGLRDDGVVVWREITNTTNSPAERTVFTLTNWLPYSDGMIIITNWQPFYDDLIPKWRYAPNVITTNSGVILN